MQRVRKSIAILVAIGLFSLASVFMTRANVCAEGIGDSLIYTYYLPFFASSSSEWSGVGFSNDSDTSAHVHIVAFDNNGNIVVTEDKIIAGNGQESFTVAAGVSSEGWMKAQSDQPLSGLSFAGENGYMACVPVRNATFTSLVVPHVVQDRSWDTDIIVTNPSDSQTIVTLSYIKQDGSVVYDSEQYTILANGSKKIRVSELINGEAVEAGKVKISSSEGIVAFAVCSNLRSGGNYFAGINVCEPDIMALNHSGQEYEDSVTLACVNFNPVAGDKAKTIEKMKGFMNQAAQQGANIVVFPELGLTGVFPPDQLNIIAETIPGPSTLSIAELAAELDVYVVFGMVERDGETLYNSAAVIGPEGVLGKHRKVHPIEFLEPWATKGKRLDLFDTPFGPIGIGICYSSYCFPEVARTYAAKGARIMINASAFPNFPDCDDYKSFYMTTLGARSTENSIFVASANIVGVTGGVPFFGYSTILGPKQGKMDYHIYAGPASDTEEGIVLATVDLNDCNLRPQAVQTILRDRNPRVYTPLVAPIRY